MNPEEQIKSKSDFDNINSSYILKKYLTFLKKINFSKLSNQTKKFKND